MRRLFLGLFALGTLVAGVVFGWLPVYVDRSLNRVTGEAPFEASPPARDVHRALFVVDLHGDALLWRRDPLERHRRGHLDLPRLGEAGVGLQVFSAVTRVPFGLNYEENDGDSDQLVGLTVVQGWPPSTWLSPYRRALHQAGRLRALSRRSAEVGAGEGDDGGAPSLIVVRTADDLAALRERARRGDDVVGGLLALEGLHAMEGDPAKLDSLFEAGYRMAGLTHFFDNAVAGSAHGVEKGGLTALGRRTVRRMEELGMVVDLAHASPAAFDDALEAATRPVVVSHGGVKATCPGPRNLSDEQLRRIGENGGVVGIGLWPGAVCDTTVAAAARAMEHVAETAGVEHVALGTDFDGAVTVPVDVTGLPLLTEALLERGFDRVEVRRMMGGNAARLLAGLLPERPEEIRTSSGRRFTLKRGGKVTGTRRSEMSPEIRVDHESGDEYTVTVDGNGRPTRHTVVVTEEQRSRYAPDASAEELLRESFRFLLEREPREAILSRFNLPVVEKYFPEFTSAIGDRLQEVGGPDQ